MIRKLFGGLVLLTFLVSIQGCAPPYDARAISEQEFKNDTQPAPAQGKAVGGGGTSLKKSQW